MTTASLFLSRRRFMGATGALAAGAMFAPATIGRAQEADTITLLTWEGYQPPEWVAEWEAANPGVKLKPVVISSGDEVFSQLLSGAVQPDVVYAEASLATRLKAAGQIDAFDEAKVPNIGNILPTLNWRNPLSVDGALMGIPLHWGTQPLMYNADIVTEAPTSWSALWDKAHEGKVSTFNDATVNFAMIALHIGAKDPFHLSEDEFALATDALRALRGQVRVVTNGFDDSTNLYASGEAVIGYCHITGIVHSLKKKGMNFAYSLPKEGTPSWIEGTYVTPKGQRDSVYKFLNDTMSLEWQSRFMSETGSNGVLTAEVARQAGLSDEFLAGTDVLNADSPELKENLVFMRDPEDAERRIQIWNDFLAGTL